MYRHVEPGQQRPKNEVTAEHIVDKLAKRRIELSIEQVRGAHSSASRHNHVPDHTHQFVGYPTCGEGCAHHVANWT
jgi:hypothetical protein